MTRIAVEREIIYYEASDGKVPFKDWFESLKSKEVQQRVDARLDRVSLGNLGFHEGVGEGVIELKFNDGTRVYYGEDGPKIIVLLIGGNKSSQPKDIRKAKEFWSDYKWRKKHEKK